MDAWRGGVVLLCRGTDPIRVWPLPVVQPWWEEDRSLTFSVRIDGVERTF